MLDMKESILHNSNYKNFKNGSLVIEARLVVELARDRRGNLGVLVILFSFTWVLNWSLYDNSLSHEFMICAFLCICMISDIKIDILGMWDIYIRF